MPRSGLITLIGLAAKNADPDRGVCEEVRVDRGEDLVQLSTLDAVKLRLRPIVMTSLAFILGVLLLVLACHRGAGAIARRTIGFTVLGGMTAATTIAIFIVPVLFVLITKMSYGEETTGLAAEGTSRRSHGESEGKWKRRTSTPELEYELQKARDQNNPSANFPNTRRRNQHKPIKG